MNLTYLGDVVGGKRVVRVRDAAAALGGAGFVLELYVAGHVALVDVLAAHLAWDPRVALADPLAGRADGARVPVRHLEDVVLGVILLLLRYCYLCWCRLLLLLTVFLREARALPSVALHG